MIDEIKSTEQMHMDKINELNASISLLKEQNEKMQQMFHDEIQKNEQREKNLKEQIQAINDSFTFLQECIENPKKVCQLILEQINSGETTTVNLPFGIPRVPSHMFYNNKLLTEVKIPSSCTVIEMNAFGGCTSLVKVEIPPSVIEIGPFAFCLCSLVEVFLPDSVLSINNSAFNRCFALTKINIPNSVISIGSYAFVWCKSLKKILIPQSVRTIGYDAFGGCSSLEIVKIHNFIKDIGDDAFPRNAKIEKYGDVIPQMD